MLRASRNGLRLLVATAVLFTTVGVASAALAPGGTFVDDDGSPHEGHIEAIAAVGITSGCGPTEFCPKDPVTREQMAAFLARALQLPPTNQSPFTDTDGIFFDNINRLAAAGITGGCSPTEFCPKDPVTREQMAAFLARGLQLPPTNQSPFTDTDGIFFDNINRLAAAGITNGCNPPDNTRFCPSDPITREEMATFLTRSLGLAVPFVPEPLPTLASSDGRDWDMVFSDNFYLDQLDQDKWTTCYWWDRDGCTIGSNFELEWYQPDAVEVENGTLRLIARPQTIRASDGKTYEYISGMVSTGRDIHTTETPARFDFTYGFAEARVRIPSGQGLWPALWMLPSTHVSKPEIDIMEVIGQDPDVFHAHVHYIDGSGTVQAPGSTWTGPDFSADWHTFAVDWQPDKLTWLVDGVERWQFTDPEGIPAEPMYLLLNLAVGGDWPGPPNDDTEFPAVFEVDYMRVWQENG